MFKAYERSIELIRELKPLVQRLGKQDPDLAKQLRKAASSVALNLAEGNRRGGKDKPYHFRVADPTHLVAHCDYGGPITAIVGRDNMIGTQFHPEKSQATGLALIAAFLRWAP